MALAFERAETDKAKAAQLKVVGAAAAANAAKAKAKRVSHAHGARVQAARLAPGPATGGIGANVEPAGAPPGSLDSNVSQLV